MKPDGLVTLLEDKESYVLHFTHRLLQFTEFDYSRNDSTLQCDSKWIYH